MPSPARWQDDPDCGHEVVCEYQTHYCTYIRVPRLLSLQRLQGDHPDELLILLGLQTYELWFKVLIRDLERAVDRLRSPDANTYELTKLLVRSTRIISFLDHQTETAASLLHRQPDIRLRIVTENEKWISPQLARLIELNTDLGASLSRTEANARAALLAGRDYLHRFADWQVRMMAFLDACIELDGADAPGYPEYLALPELYELQNAVKGDWTDSGKCPQGMAPTTPISPDELLFIVVHQAFELWFRAILSELDTLSDLLIDEPADLPTASQHLRRVIAIQKLLAEQILLPASMLPMDFLQFRDETRLVDEVQQVRGLSPASGTESYQFREIEILAGLKGSVAFQEFLHGTEAAHIRFLTPRQRDRLADPSLPEIFDALVLNREVDSLHEIFTPADEPNPHHDLAELADLLLEFDQYFQLWRVNHLTMVQSMIGRKSGTGFLGPEYLKETVGMGLQGEDDRLYATPQVRPRFFERLWEARTRLQPGSRQG